jgi:hypothetical protein
MLCCDDFDDFCYVFQVLIGAFALICLVCGAVTGGVILSPCDPQRCPNPNPNLKFVPIAFFSGLGLAILLLFGTHAIKILRKKLKESKNRTKQEERRQEEIMQQIQEAALISPLQNVSTAPTL